jgi:hypothetical protein
MLTTQNTHTSCSSLRCCLPVYVTCHVFCVHTVPAAQTAAHVLPLSLMCCRPHQPPTVVARASLLTEPTSQSPAQARCAARALLHLRVPTCCTPRTSAQMRMGGLRSALPMEALWFRNLGSHQLLGQVQGSAKLTCLQSVAAQQVVVHKTTIAGPPSHALGRPPLTSFGRTSQQAPPTALSHSWRCILTPQQATNSCRTPVSTTQLP